MKKDNYSTFTLEELKQREKTQKTATGIFIGCVMVMVLAGIFITFKNGFGVFSIMPVAFLPLMIINIKNLKEIRSAIAQKEGQA
jgi:hypothetical protein